MNILQIAGIGIIAALLAIIIKQQRPDLALLVSLAAGAFIFVMVLGNVRAVVAGIEQMAERANLNAIYLTTVLKVVGIAYIAEFGSQICSDAGEKAIASKIELGGKILIMVLSLPILTALMEVILNILPQ